MPIPHAASALTDTDRKEIDEIFQVPPQAIAVDKMHELAARVFSESMTALNQLNYNSNPANIKAQIQFIKNRYQEYFVLIHDYIYQSCQDQKGVEAWLRIANDCQEKYNDMMGHIIRNALAKIIAEKNIPLPTLAETNLYKKLYKQYFPMFSVTDDYRVHLLGSRKPAIAPALQFYFNHLEDSIKREEEHTKIRDMRRLLTDDEWKLVTTNLAGKSESAVYEQIDRVLLNLGKSQHVSLICEVLKELRIDDNEHLWRKFITTSNYFAEKNKLEPDPFIIRFKGAVNPKLVRTIPAAPTLTPATAIEADNVSAQETKPQVTRAQTDNNFEGELRLAKSEKDEFNIIRKKSALSDNEIKQAIQINNKLIHIYLRQRNACEERYAGSEIPPNEYQLQACINTEIDALKADNASLRKKLFKPEEHKIERLTNQPAQTAEIEVIIKTTTTTKERPADIISISEKPIPAGQEIKAKEAINNMKIEPAADEVKPATETKEKKERKIDTTHGKFVYKRKTIPGAEKVEPPKEEQKPEILIVKPETESADQKKLKS